MDLKKIVRTVSTCVTLALIFNSGEANASVYDYEDYPVYSEIGNPEYKDFLYEMYRNLPPNILDALERNNCHIIILENEDSVEKVYKDIYRKSLSTKAMGLTVPEFLLAFTEGCEHDGYYEKYNIESTGITEEDFYKLLSAATLVHEIGHVLDSLSKFKVSQSDEFKEIYKMEVSNYKNMVYFKVAELGVNKNINNELEYFASSFSCYFLYPEELLKNCPNTYNYIDSFVKSIDDTYGSEFYLESPKTH